MVATTARTARTARFAPRTLAILVDFLLARRESVARSAEALRSEVADAMSQRDLSDLFDQEDPSADSDATTALMLVEWVSRRLLEVEEVLARVADGTYGYCVDCGTGIPLERLKALSATARCVECSRRPSYRTQKLVDRDHARSNKIQGRSLVGSGTSVRGVER